jgi:hypothetical protein
MAIDWLSVFGDAPIEIPAGGYFRVPVRCVLCNDWEGTITITSNQGIGDTRMGTPGALDIGTAGTLGSPHFEAMGEWEKRARTFYGD